LPTGASNIKDMKSGIEFILRPPESRDLAALLHIEQRSFTTDHLSRRRMRHWIHAKNRAFLVCEAKGKADTAAIAGYILFFYRQTNTVARLYSIAVSEEYRGYGIARQLMNAGEQQLRRDKKNRIQLEVRPDNHAAIALYHSLGYQQFAIYPEFYEDGGDALRFGKTLV